VISTGKVIGVISPVKYFVLAFDLSVKYVRESWLPGTDVARLGKVVWV